MIYPCKAGCDTAEAATLVDELSDFTDPVAPADGLVTASQTDPDGDQPSMVTLVMATPWEAGSRHSIVLARISVIPADVTDVQHMLRSIYDSAHGRA